MRNTIENSGFTPPAECSLGNERRTVALAELVASAALALGTIVVATVVTVGIARADVADGVIGNEGGVFAIALLLGLAFLGMSGLASFLLPGHKPKKF